jgi:ketosteroid isomerase-like protein
MSDDNVEVIHELWDAYSRGDFDQVLALCDPHLVTISLEEGPLYGSDAARENYQRWHEAWGKRETILEEVRGVGDHVFVTARFRARGRAKRGRGGGTPLRGLRDAQPEGPPRR